MTVASTVRQAGPFVGDALTTVFPFAFKCFSKNDLVATLTVIASGVQTTLVVDSDYTVALNADQDAAPGGSITYNPSGSPMPATNNLTITSNVAQTQTVTLNLGGGFFPKVISDALDRAVILIQELALKFSRGLAVAIGDTTPGLLPTAAARALKFLAFDASGNPIASAGGASSPVSGAMAPVVAAATIAAARTAMGVAASGANTDIISLNAPALGAATATTQAASDSTTKVATTAQVQAAITASAQGQGQCQLQYVNTTSIKLVPWNGNLIKVNGVPCTVPDAGVTLSNAGLTAATKYYVYATASGGAVNALEASTTAYATSTTAGNKGNVIKNGDDTRTLVGMVYMNTGAPGTFGSSSTWQGVRSWFNDQGIAGNSGLAADKTTGSATYVKMDSTTDITFITWANETVQAWATGVGQSSTTANDFVALGIDGTTPEDAQSMSGGTTGVNYPIAVSTPARAPGEGNHTLSVLGATTAGTFTMNGASAPVSSTKATRTSFGISSKGVNP